VVQGAFGPDSVRSRQDGLCGQRNKTRMKQYRGLSSAHPNTPPQGGREQIGADA
jgi:hypothetical protein